MLNDNCLRALARGADEGFQRAAIAEIARLEEEVENEDELIRVREPDE